MIKFLVLFNLTELSATEKFTSYEKPLREEKTWGQITDRHYRKWVNQSADPCVSVNQPLEPFLKLLVNRMWMLSTKIEKWTWLQNTKPQPAEKCFSRFFEQIQCLTRDDHAATDSIYKLAVQLLLSWLCFGKCAVLRQALCHHINPQHESEVKLFKVKYDFCTFSDLPHNLKQFAHFLLPRHIHFLDMRPLTLMEYFGGQSLKAPFPFSLGRLQHFDFWII